jgi:hypothetical protein
VDQVKISEIIQRRRGRYLAQTLSAFEERLIPLLPAEAAGEIQAFKGLVRERFDALAFDADELIGLLVDGGEKNGAAIELRDTVRT